ncbi:hypothetical protein B0O99DRAFT_600459 [Bisporella sp. PMI_857]|nr:hypothetical protein B0O99DRAFT_600459 [Bisporella sp. PMI_857]
MRVHRWRSPWPLLENNIHILRYWIVCIVNDNSNLPPSKAQLLDADFFDCPQEPLLREESNGNRTVTFKLPSSTVESIEAIQELGRISHSNHTVECERNKLNGQWGTYYRILWNSQQFAVRLSYLILQQDSLPIARTALRRLLARLDNSTKHFLVARQLGCAAAFFGCGIATFGVGALAACGTAGGSIVSHEIKEREVRTRIAALEKTFRRLKDLRLTILP